MGLAGRKAWGQRLALLMCLLQNLKSGSTCREGKGGLLGTAFHSSSLFLCGAVGVQPAYAQGGWATGLLSVFGFTEPPT